MKNLEDRFGIKYKNRDDAINKIVFRLISTFPILILFPLITVYIISIYDTNKFFLYIYLLLNIPYLIIAFFIKRIYKKYAVFFVHATIAKFHLICFILIYLLVSYVLFYSIYVLNFNYNIYILILFILLSICIYAICSFKKNIKKNFSMCFFLINSKVFIDYSEIKLKVMEPASFFSKILYALLIYTVFQGIFVNFVITLGLVSLVLFSLLTYHVCELIYFNIFFMPYIENHFKQPVLSDYWGLFEVDPVLGKKILGSNLSKIPIQYANIFTDNKK